MFFDFDGVLTTDRTGSTTTCRYLSSHLGVPLQAVSAAFARYNRALTLGETTHQAVWPGICAEMGCAVPLQVLQDAFDSTPMDDRMLALAGRLRAACRVGMITDNKADRMKRLRALHRLDDLFDPIVVSAEAGMSKSSPALFEHALTRACVKAREAVFIDNDHDNVAVAAACGIHGVHFDDVQRDVRGLAERLAGFGLLA